MSDNEFEKANEGDSLTYPRAAGDLKKGDFLLIGDHPCRVLETSTSKTGKHGHAKSKIVAMDIFTNQKVEDVLPSSHNVDCPFVAKTEYQLVGIEGDYVTFIDAEGTYREDLKLNDDDDFVEDLRKDFSNGNSLTINVTAAMGREQIVGYKQAKD